MHKYPEMCVGFPSDTGCVVAPAYLCTHVRCYRIAHVCLAITSDDLSGQYSDSIP